MKHWMIDQRKRARRRNPMATILRNQRRWIARRHQDGVWSYDRAISAGGGR